MVSGFKIENNEAIETKERSKNFWLHLENPSDEEIAKWIEGLPITKEKIKKALDKSELSHVEIVDDYIVYIINIPYLLTNGRKRYRTFPIGIFLFKEGIITTSILPHPIFEDMKNDGFNHLSFDNHDLFPMQIIGKSTEYYLKYLTEIQEDIRLKEKDLLRATSNKDLEHLLTLQKSLLYFTTSLQGNRTILDKLENNLKLSVKEKDTLKDAQIEIRQGIETANICREILENTMNTYSSIISNNLNDIMKFLTSITLIISIPTMIASFLGMNVFLGDFGSNPFSFLLIVCLSFFVCVLLILLLKKKNLL